MNPGFDSRALSQSEIDALLAKLATEETDAGAASQQSWKSVKVYDFRRPDKLSKDQMRTLQLIHESFGRLTSSALSAYLRTSVQLNLVSIDQGVYGEYAESVPPDTVLHILTVEPLPGNVLLGIDMAAAMAAVDRLLGGSGMMSDVTRAPTEIELALIQTLVANMLRAMVDAWSRVVDLKPAIRHVALDSGFVQVALKTDPVVVIAFEMGILHRSGTISICIPYVVLEPVLPKLSAQLWFASGKRSAGAQLQELRRNLDMTGVELSVELGDTTVTLQELRDLREGDVVLLSRSIGQPLDVLVGGKRKFVARPGKVGNKLAVQIVGVAETAVMAGAKD